MPLLTYPSIRGMCGSNAQSWGEEMRTAVMPLLQLYEVMIMTH